MDGLVVKHTLLASSRGTPPEGGIDFEPNAPENLLRNILLDDVTLSNNTLRSITLSTHVQYAYSATTDYMLSCAQLKIMKCTHGRKRTRGHCWTFSPPTPPHLSLSSITHRQLPATVHPPHPHSFRAVHWAKVDVRFDYILCL